MGAPEPAAEPPDESEAPMIVVDRPESTRTPLARALLLAARELEFGGFECS